MGLLASEDWGGSWLAAESEAERDARTVKPIWVEGDLGPDGARAFKLLFDTPSAGATRLMIATKGELRRVLVGGHELDVEPWSRIAFGGPPAYIFDVQLAAGRHELIADVVQIPHPLVSSKVAIAAHVAMPSVCNQGAGGSWLSRVGDHGGWLHADLWSEQPAFPWPPSPARLLRTEFDLRPGLVGARLHVAALGGYEVRLNGQRVGDAELQGEPADYRLHIPYRTYDVTSLLADGANAIGMVVADGFYASYVAPGGRYSFGEAPRRIRLSLILQFDDDTMLRVATDPSWRTADGPLRRSEIYAGEHWDLRIAAKGWDRPHFDDSTWSAAWTADEPSGALVVSLAPPIRAIAGLRPIEIRNVGQHRHVVDFGQNFAGRVRLTAEGMSGARIVVRHSELLDEAGELDTRNLRIADATDSFVLGDEERVTLEPTFTYHGFRYAEVSGVEDLQVADIEGVVLSSDLGETGGFTISEPVIQKLWHNALWSQRSNFVGIPTDCPQRDERLGWTGDAQVFWDTAAFNMDIGAFTRSFMREMRGAQAPNGAFPLWAPQSSLWHSLAGEPMPGWADAGIELPYVAYLHTADRRIVDENWAAMSAYVDGVLANNPDHVWRNGRGLDLGDWLSFDAVEPMDETTPKDLIGTAMLARSLGRLAAMAAWTSRPAEAALRRSQADATKAAFVREFVQDDGEVGNGSNASYILALRLGLVPERLRSRAGALLAADIRRRGTMLSTGFLGTPLALDALADVGEVELAYSLLLRREFPSWGYMVERGATTIWERWNGDTADIQMNSFNHYALGAVCAFLYRRVAGIEPLEPGFGRFRIAPLLDSRIDWARGHYDSVRGRIESGWHRAGDRVAFDVQIPIGTEGELRLPGRVIDSDKLSFDPESGLSTGSVESGLHRFETVLS
jgi:alpha-L-rhamnosidase